MSALQSDQLNGLVATFIPFDPPRGSWFALWDPTQPGGLLAESQPVPLGLEHLKRVDVELVVPAAQRGTESIIVSALKLPMVDATPLLTQLPSSASVDPTVHAWARVMRAALRVISRGSVLPWVSPDGWDTWRVDPLGPEDLALVNVLADGLPAHGHCTPAGSQKGHISDPRFAIRACFDAIADRLIRSPAASLTASSAMFAQLAPTRVRHLRPWVNDIAGNRCASATLCLQVFPPESFSDDEEDWRLVYQMRSAADPSLVVDAATVWDSVYHGIDDSVIARLGDSVDILLLAALRRLGLSSELFRGALAEKEPTHIDLGSDEFDRFLDAVGSLEATGIVVRWPAGLVSPRLERRLVVGAPISIQRGGDALSDLLNVNWELLLDGIALTSDELQVISEAKRAIVPIRGRWVRIDREGLERLKSSPPHLSPGELLAAVMGQPIEMPDSGEIVHVRLETTLDDLARRVSALSGEREAEHPEGLKAELRPYQRRGLAWLSDLTELGLGGVLADDMGLGKTVQLLALHQARQGPTMVVCPTSVLTNWEREAKRFCSDVRVLRYHGANRKLPPLRPGDLVITTYGVVRSDAEKLAKKKWDLVVADEAQHIKNPRSRSARSLRTIPSTARIALTGTPVENRLTELWSILDWAVPGLLGTLEQFKRTTAVPIERDGDPRATRRLASIISPFLLRRRKSDPGIAPELPPKIERDVVVPLTPEQVTLYKATTAEVLENLKENEGFARQGLVLKLLTSLKQITNHPAHYLRETGPLDGRSGKLEALELLISNAAEAGESSLIFTQYVAMAHLINSHLASRGERAEVLHGGLTPAQRQLLVDDFQAGKIKILVLSLKAAGTGLNLTKASQVIHYDRWWNPAVEDQATDRAYRIGQDKAVTVHRLITEGTVEDRVAQLLEEKRALADKVVGASGEGWIGNLNDDELTALVSLDEPLPIFIERRAS